MTETRPKQNGNATNTPQPYVPSLWTPMYVASAPTDPVRTTAMAELPHLSCGINDQSRDLRGAAAISSDSAGMTLNERKNMRFTIGTKNNATNQSSNRADLNRLVV